MSSYFSEATYAFQLGKPIIPVKVEEDYDADGWIGILLAGRKYTKAYTNDMLKANMPELFKELEAIEKDCGRSRTSKKLGSDSVDIAADRTICGISVRFVLFFCFGFVFLFFFHVLVNGNVNPFNHSAMN